MTADARIFFLARTHLRKKDRRRYSKCRRGWEIGSFADKQCRVGMWNEVGGRFAANAAWGMLSMTGMADASARGGACGAVFPQIRSEDAAEGGGRWTRRHAERRAGLVCRKCGPGEDAGRGCRRGCRERTPIGCREGGRKQGAGSREQEQGAEQGTGARNRSTEQERGTGAGKRGGVGFFKAVSGFFTILAGWNEIIIQTIWLKR